MKTLLRFLPLMLSFLLSCPLYGQDFGVIRTAEATHDGDSLCISLSLHPDSLVLHPTEVLTIAPYVVGVSGSPGTSADTIAFAPIHVLGRQAYYRYIRHDNLGIIMSADCVIWDKRRYCPFVYVERAAWQPWIDRASLYVDVRRTDCSTGRSSEVRLLVQRPSREMHVTDSRSIVRKGSLSDRTTVVFPVNRTEVHPELANNERELDKIRRSIETVENDSSMLLRRLTIKGYASPEGPYDNNVRLARERTDSIGAYVARYFHLDSSKIHTEYEPEDWQGLIEAMKKTTLRQLPHRDELIEIARRDMEPDQKERLIRTRYPSDYAYLLQHILPWLRHTDYRIDYDHRVVDTAQGDTFYVERMPAATSQRIPQYMPLRPYQALFALKTNLLFDAALAFNVEAELPLGRSNRWSVMAEYWTPWYVWHHNSRSYELQVWGVEGRYWLGRCRQLRPALTGGFLGLYYAYGRYDFEWKSSGDQGELNSVGATIGYSWPIHRHWNLELSASVGFFHGPRRHYTGEYNDTHLIWQYTSSTTYVGPTKLKLTLSWLIGKKRKEARP